MIFIYIEVERKLINTRIRDAKEEGKKNTKWHRQKILKRNMSIEDIKELTGLTLEELKKLK